jgi:DnaD/phage-associated family protein
MTGFAGFPDGPVKMIPVPEAFFTRLLPAIDNLEEWKITLYALWALSRREGGFRCLTRTGLRKDRRLMGALAAGGGDADAQLTDALERAAARGTLIAVQSESPEEKYYFLNTSRGRAGAEALARGEWKPEEGEDPAGMWIERPNLFTLYEQNIGPLTPVMADLLRDAEREYSAEWVGEAIKIAVEHNARSWKYVSAVLERWKKEGYGGRRASGEGDRRKYVEGDYADFIEH